MNTLPLLFVIFFALQSRNPGFDLPNGRLDSVERHIDRLAVREDEIRSILRDIQSTLKDLDRRVMALEQRSSPIVRG